MLSKLTFFQILSQAKKLKICMLNIYQSTTTASIHYCCYLKVVRKRKNRVIIYSHFTIQHKEQPEKELAKKSDGMKKHGGGVLVFFFYWFVDDTWLNDNRLV